MANEKPHTHELIPEAKSSEEIIDALLVALDEICRMQEIEVARDRAGQALGEFQDNAGWHDPRAYCERCAEDSAREVAERTRLWYQQNDNSASSDAT